MESIKKMDAGKWYVVLTSYLIGVLIWAIVFLIAKRLFAIDISSSAEMILGLPALTIIERAWTADSNVRFPQRILWPAAWMLIASLCLSACFFLWLPTPWTPQFGLAIGVALGACMGWLLTLARSVVNRGPESTTGA